MTAKEIRLCVALTCALVLLAGCVAPPPPSPAQVHVPIEIGPGGTPPVFFEKVIYRIPTGTRIGHVYDRYHPSREIGETVFHDKQLGTESYNILVTDHLRGLGYDAVDPTEAAFTEDSTVKARFRMIGVVKKVEIDTYVAFNATAERNYQQASVEMEVRLYDASVADVVFRGTYSGGGMDVGPQPDALPGAVINALDGALADPAFVAKVESEQASPARLAGLAVPACTGPARHLPADMAAVSQAVVTVRLGAAVGSGVIVSPVGLVLTAAHVVAAGRHPEVTLESGLTLEAGVERIDRVADVALLRIPGKNHHCTPLRTEPPVEVGSAVFAIGSPLDSRLAGSVTRGIVSGHPVFEGVELLQTDAPVNPGSSGGPLVDDRGRVIGIVTSKALGIGIEGVAFGVPVSVTRERLSLDLGAAPD